MDERKTMQSLKDKKTKGHTLIFITLHRKLRFDNEIHTSLVLCFIP
jgi:hypothetical protein